MCLTEWKMLVLVAGTAIVLANLATAIQATAMAISIDAEAEKQSVDIDNAIKHINSRE
jgi:hypothetical protein